MNMASVLPAKDQQRSMNSSLTIMLLNRKTNMFRINKYTFLLSISLLLAGLMAPAANATLMLRVFDGISTYDFEDNGASDGSPITGLLTTIPVVSGFALNVITGVSKPIIGADPNHGRLDLNSVNISSGLGTLTIMLTDTDFHASTGIDGFLTEIGGTLDGDISVRTYVDDANNPFATSTLIAEMSSSASFFSSAVDGSADLSGLYSITHVVELTHTGAGQISSFDLITTVPEPNTLALIGLGILLLVGYSKSANQSRQFSSSAC